MDISEPNQILDLATTLVDLADYRKADRIAGDKHDPLIVFAAYAQDEMVYKDGLMIQASQAIYKEFQRVLPNELVNKFGLAYADNSPIFLHKRLADVMVDVAIDMRDRHSQYTVVMDGLRTYDCAVKLQDARPDLVKIGLLTKAGYSAHNRALAVDSKLFHIIDLAAAMNPSIPLPITSLQETDECGHLDDLNMETNSRFYEGPMSDAARINRLNRLQAWQRASVKNKLPIANLLSEFWDDRVTGSPADFWRVLTCRAMCVGMNGNPKTNPILGELKEELDALHTQNKHQDISRKTFARKAYANFIAAWDHFFTKQHRMELIATLGPGGAEPPELKDFIFHEWIDNIFDQDLVRAGFPRQSRVNPVEIFSRIKAPAPDLLSMVSGNTAEPPPSGDPLRQLFEEAKKMLQN